MKVNDVWKKYKHERLRAIWDSLDMWSDVRYKRFVCADKPGKLDTDWFDWFVSTWGVARTLNSRSRGAVRNYLDREFRTAIEQKPSASTVDIVDEYIQKRGWSARKRMDGKGSSVRSLVSKVGFFFCPDKMVPYDSFARKGLNVLRGSLRSGGDGPIHPKNYDQYLDAFNEMYLAYRPLLAAELRAPWVKELSRQFGCPKKLLITTRFQRKTFDNYLVHVGRTMQKKQ